jgi:uncharacterized protein (DUF305 family)
MNILLRGVLERRLLFAALVAVAIAALHGRAAFPNSCVGAVDPNMAKGEKADSAFATMMIAHHQGAIDMARTELQYGHDEQLRRLAQEIIVTQLEEIAVMQRAISTPLSVGHEGH